MNEKVIQYAVAEFEKALRYMQRARSFVHAFDVGVGRHTGVCYSILIVAGTRAEITEILGLFGPIETVDVSGKTPNDTKPAVGN